MSPTGDPPGFKDDPVYNSNYKKSTTKSTVGEDPEVSSDDDSKPDVPLATISEVFSFAEKTSTKIYIGLGVFFAIISGLALPASIFYFSDVMGDISALAEEGLDPIVDVAYVMMVLGCISLVCETMQCEYTVCGGDCIMMENISP